MRYNTFLKTPEKKYCKITLIICCKDSCGNIILGLFYDQHRKEKNKQKRQYLNEISAQFRAKLLHSFDHCYHF